jgi:hypothetical protein
MSAELAVLEDVAIELVADLVEVIHVELADEGGEVAVAEVGRQDLLLEPLHIQDGEVCPLFVPADDPRMLIALRHTWSTSRIS